VRKARSLQAALPLYLKGISSGEMDETLKVLGGLGRRRFVCQYGIALETGLGARVP